MFTSANQGPEIQGQAPHVGRRRGLGVAFGRVRSEGQFTARAVSQQSRDAARDTETSFARSSSLLGGLSRDVSVTTGSIGGLVRGLGDLVNGVAGKILDVGKVAGIGRHRRRRGVHRSRLGAAVPSRCRPRSPSSHWMTWPPRRAFRSKTSPASKPPFASSYGTTEDATKALDGLSTAYFRIAQEGDKPGNAFSKIGVSVLDATGSMRPFQDVLKRHLRRAPGDERPRRTRCGPWATRRGAARARSLEAQAATELFGSSAQRIVDTISRDPDDKSGKGFFERFGDAAKYGTVMTDAYVKKVRESEAETAEADERLHALGIKVTQDWIPIFSSNPLREFIADNVDGLESLSKKGADTFQKLPEHGVRRVRGIGATRSSAKSPSPRARPRTTTPASVRVQVDGKTVWLDRTGKPTVTLGDGKGPAKPAVSSDEDDDEDDGDATPAAVQPRRHADPQAWTGPGRRQGCRPETIGRPPSSTAARTTGSEAGPDGGKAGEVATGLVAKIGEGVRSMRAIWLDVHDAYEGTGKLGDIVPWLKGRRPWPSTLPRPSPGRFVGMIERLFVTVTGQAPSLTGLLHGVAPRLGLSRGRIHRHGAGRRLAVLHAHRAGPAGRDRTPSSASPRRSPSPRRRSAALSPAP